MLKEGLQKFGKRTIMIPGSMVALMLTNDQQHLGIDFRVMVVAVAASLLWSAIETWRDTSLIKAGLWHDPRPKTPTTP